MKIIVGHANLDLDCLGSMVLARALYPDHRLVRGRLIHPVARNLYNLYQNHLDLLPLEELRAADVDRIVVVDTRSAARIREVLEQIPDFRGEVEVFDHHPADTSDIPGAILRDSRHGANTTQLGLRLREAGRSLGTEDATIALAGIYADTGNFTHENVTPDDFRVAAWLMGEGASLRLVRTFLQTLKEEHQITLFHEILNRLVYRQIQGYLILFSRMDLEQQAGGLAAVVEKVFEIENPDAFFAVFTFRREKDALIVARSQREAIDVQRVLGRFGGGGHARAASALLKDVRPAGEGEDAACRLVRLLEGRLKSGLAPEITAGELMTRPVDVLGEGMSLREASLALEAINHTGAPVIDAQGALVGFLTLRDIMKGRRAGQMSAPVRSYMTHKVISAPPGVTVREVENLMFRNNIGHLPIVAGERVVGIVTRSDYLRHMELRETAPG